MQEPAGCQSREHALLHGPPPLQSFHQTIPGKAQCFILVTRVRINRQPWPQNEAVATGEILGLAFLQTVMAGQTRKGP